MSCCISAAVLGARDRDSAAGAKPPEMIAADRIAPAVVDADTTNPERILCVISIPNAPFVEVLMRIFDCVPRRFLNANYGRKVAVRDRTAGRSVRLLAQG
jgi:hypothetical protein